MLRRPRYRGVELGTKESPAGVEEGRMEGEEGGGGGGGEQ